MAPLYIQNMFAVVDNKVNDVTHRRVLYSIIRDCIEFRNRRLPDSCNMDVIFNNRKQLENEWCRWTDRDVALFDELFTLSGHLLPTTSPSPTSVCQPPPSRQASIASVNQEVNTIQTQMSNELVIDAQGFKTIVINFGNGKKIVITA